MNIDDYKKYTQPSPPPNRDSCFTVTYEYGGWLGDGKAIPRYILRFCGEYLGHYDTEASALADLRNHPVSIFRNAWEKEKNRG